MSVLRVIALFSALIYVAESDNPCGDWEPYKDQKCLKITDSFLGYDDAENICLQQNATLISIDVEEKQTFFENFLKSNKIADNAWIGLKYINSIYTWSDGSISYYKHWATGSPKNNSDYCVQIQTDDIEFGQWSDVLCTKRNLVICEKIQPWSLDQLQSTLMNLVKNIVPIGFIYVQLPKEKSPLDIWPWMEWKIVSSDYAGVFFRSEGGNALPFGQTQTGDSPRLTHMKQIFVDRDGNDEVSIAANGQYSDPLDIRGYTGGDHELQLMVSSAEVRPINMAIRIWKRVG